MSLAKVNSKIARSTEKINVLSNGGFTRFNHPDVFTTLSATERSELAIVYDPALYRRATAGWSIDGPVSDQLGDWTLSGVPATYEVAPKKDGSIIPSFDGGNILKITLRGDGAATLVQELPDPYILWDAPYTIAFSGRQFKGKITLKISIFFDEEEVIVLTANSATFGDYRRFFSSEHNDRSPSKVSVCISVEGCEGESIGLSGVCLTLGSTAFTPFVPSWCDRVAPRGMIIMYEGDACPSGYREVSEDPKMLLVTGSSFQSHNGFVRTMGQDEHDHLISSLSALDPASDAVYVTKLPMLNHDLRLIRGVPFHNYPENAGNNVPFEPYPGERPLWVLTRGHSHRLRTKMSSVPPTFPVRMCVKL